LASCGRGSQPRAREVRGNDGRVLRPGCEELSLQASAPMPEWEARVPGPKIAKVERREGECTAARCTPRLASAAKFAPLGAPPPLIGKRQESLKTRALRRRGNVKVRADGSAQNGERQDPRPAQPKVDGIDPFPMIGHGRGAPGHIPMGLIHNRPPACVTPGLDQGVHPSSQESIARKMDCRVEPGNDESWIKPGGKPFLLCFMQIKLDWARNRPSFEPGPR
jgi:hypothetical protein